MRAFQGQHAARGVAAVGVGFHESFGSDHREDERRVLAVTRASVPGVSPQRSGVSCAMRCLTRARRSSFLRESKPKRRQVAVMSVAAAGTYLKRGSSKSMSRAFVKGRAQHRRPRWRPHFAVITDAIPEAGALNRRARAWRERGAYGRASTDGCRGTHLREAAR